MKLDIPKITRSIVLADYAKEFGAGVVEVWVNPPRDMLTVFTSLLARNEKIQADIKTVQPEDVEQTKVLSTEAKQISEGFFEWYARLWSQGSDTTKHWTADDVRVVMELETDPGLYQWLTRRSWELINEHRTASRKN